jgi:hypothetical protein
MFERIRRLGYLCFIYNYNYKNYLILLLLLLPDTRTTPYKVFNFTILRVVSRMRIPIF